MKTRQILITSTKQKHIIAINEIVFIKALNIYSLIHLQNGITLQSSETITQIEQQISSTSFYRTHRSYLLNIFFISSYRKTDKKIVMKHFEIEIPLARDKIKDFENTLNKLFLVKK